MKKMSQLSLLSASITAASLLLASTAGFAANSYKGENYKGEMAAPCPVEPTLKDGFYVGAQVGYDAYAVRESNSFTDAAGDFFQRNPSVSANGWVGGLMAGYGQYFNNYWYLGGEVFINTSDAQNSYGATVKDLGAAADTYTAKFTVNSSYGIGLLPGIKLNPTTLFYVRLGYNWANLKGQETADGFSASDSNRSSGFNYGLGMESLIMDNFSLRGEYTHTNYNSFSDGFHTSFSPSDNQFMLGLIYHFA